MANKVAKTPVKGQTIMKKNIGDNIAYYLMMAPWMALIIIFMYVPLFGNILAFQDYKGGTSFIGPNTVWVGFKHFKEFLTSYYFVRIMRNTIVLNLIGLFMGFWVPIAFALLLNELPFEKLKKTIQTVSYMPHFISAVVVASMFIGYIADNGLIPKFLLLFGVEVKALNTNAQFFPWYYTFINVWKGFGWSSILYLSTITSVDPGLYEAAELDGANRWRRMWHVTLPELKPLIIIQLIFAIGGMLGSNTEFMLLMYNSSVYETADVLGTYLYRDGLLGGRFSYGTACNLIMSVIGFTLTYITNKVSDKVADFSLW